MINRSLLSVLSAIIVCGSALVVKDRDSYDKVWVHSRMYKDVRRRARSHHRRFKKDTISIFLAETTHIFLIEPKTELFAFMASTVTRGSLAIIIMCCSEYKATE